MDPVIVKAYRNPGFSVNDLPEIPDYEHAAHVAATAFPHLDPSAKAGKPRHILFGILWVYSKLTCSYLPLKPLDPTMTLTLTLLRIEYMYAGMAAALLFKSVAALLGPYAIKQLLAYLESGGENTTTKPWVWILALLFGPMLGTIFSEINVALVARMIVRLQNVITLLVFERALKMRFTENALPDVAAAPADHAPSATDEADADGEGSTQLEITADSEPTLQDHSEDGTEVDGEGSVSLTTTHDPPSPPASTKGLGKETKKDGESTETKNLVGRLTNLVSTDLNNITQGTCAITCLSLPQPLCAH